MIRGDRTLAPVWWRDHEEDWKFAPTEQPATPGAPANPDHSLGLRLAYATVAVLVGITGGLGNALVLDNLPQLQGALGDYWDTGPDFVTHDTGAPGPEAVSRLAG
jgi:hypothetical protein